MDPPAHWETMTNMEEKLKNYPELFALLQRYVKKNGIFPKWISDFGEASSQQGVSPNVVPLGPNVSPNGAPVASLADVAPNGVVLGPGVSPNGDNGTAPDSVPLGPSVSPNGSLKQPKKRFL